jgi:hypothetical protein
MGSDLPRTGKQVESSSDSGSAVRAALPQIAASFAVLCGIAILTGCSKHAADSLSTQTRLGPDGIDVSAVQQAFKTTEAGDRFSLDDNLRMIGAGAYGDATQGLQKMAANPKTTPEQKKALEDLLQTLSQLPAIASNR